MRVMASWDPGQRPRRPQLSDDGQARETLAPPPQPAAPEPQVSSRPPEPKWQQPAPNKRARDIEILDTKFIAPRKITVYRHPNPNAPRAGVIKQGRNVRVTGWVRHNGWLRVARKNGRPGFISGDNLPNRDPEETRRWEKAKQSGRAQDYMDYVRNHSDALFADLALVFVRELARKALGGDNFRPRPGD
jgi:hypothetical protein